MLTFTYICRTVTRNPIFVPDEQSSSLVVEDGNMSSEENFISDENDDLGDVQRDALRRSKRGRHLSKENAQVC